MPFLSYEVQVAANLQLTVSHMDKLAIRLFGPRRCDNGYKWLSGLNLATCILGHTGNLAWGRCD